MKFNRLNTLLLEDIIDDVVKKYKALNDDNFAPGNSYWSTEFLKEVNNKFVTSI